VKIDDVRVVGAGALKGTCVPTAYAYSPDRRLLAVASTFDTIGWAARDVSDGRPIRNRIVLYDAESLAPIAHLDNIRTKVNSICFNPSGDGLVLAAGEYDGGWSYSGELMLWRPPDHNYVHLIEDREVSQCAFTSAGDLHIVIRPPTSEEEYRGGVDLAFEATIDAAILASAASSATSIDPESLPLASCAVPGFRELLHANERSEIANATGVAGADVRMAWDVTWVDDMTIALCRNHTAYESWSLDGVRTRDVAGAGIGVQLFTAGGRTLAHTVERLDRFSHRSHLVEISPSGQPRPIWQSDTARLMSQADTGQILAREASWGKAETHSDVIVDGGGGTTRPVGTGGYDLFNHYLRLDGLPHLFLIHGHGTKPHENKWFCRIDPQSEKVDHAFPLAEPSLGGVHILSDGGVAVPGEPPEEYVLAGQVHSPNALSTISAFIARRRLDGGVRWIHRLDTQVVAMAVLPTTENLAAVLNNGRLIVLSMTSGELILAEPLAVEGLQVFPLCLAVRGNRIAVGMADGNVLVATITPN
jgi:hypothetical protein